MRRKLVFISSERRHDIDWHANQYGDMDASFEVAGVYSSCPEVQVDTLTRAGALFGAFVAVTKEVGLRGQDRRGQRRKELKEE